jgi:hypothetical protein
MADRLTKAQELITLEAWCPRPEVPKSLREGNKAQYYHAISIVTFCVRRSLFQPFPRPSFLRQFSCHFIGTQQVRFAQLCHEYDRIFDSRFTQMSMISAIHNHTSRENMKAMVILPAATIRVVILPTKLT